MGFEELMDSGLDADLKCGWRMKDEGLIIGLGLCYLDSFGFSGFLGDLEEWKIFGLILLVGWVLGLGVG